MPKLHINKASMIHTTLSHEQELQISDGTSILHIFLGETQIEAFLSYCFSIY